jgi:hypothetical protein
LVLLETDYAPGEVVSRLMGKMLRRAFRCAGDVAA